MNPGGVRADLLAAQLSGGELVGEATYGEAFSVQPERLGGAIDVDALTTYLGAHSPLTPPALGRITRR